MSARPGVLSYTRTHAGAAPSGTTQEIDFLSYSDHQSSNGDNADDM